MIDLLKECFRAPRDVIAGIFFIISSPRALILSSIPMIIGIIAFIATAATLVSYRDEFAAFFWEPDARWLQATFEIFIALLSVVASAIVGLILMLLLGGVFLELLVERIMIDKNIVAREVIDTPFSLTSLGKSVWQSVIRSIVITFVALITIIAGLFPPLIPFVFIINGMLIGASFIDVPLSLVRMPLRARLAAQLVRPGTVLPLGVLFSLCSVIPFLGMILIGPFHYAALMKAQRSGYLTAPKPPAVRN